MKNKSTVTKKVIVSRIHKKLGKALNQRLLQDALNAICVTLQDNILQDNAISVENLGTISPYIFHSHNGINIQTGQLQVTPPFRTVKFHPHFIFLELLSQRRNNFLKKEGELDRRRRKS